MSYGTVCLRVGMRILERKDVQEVIGDPLLAEVMRTGVTNARGFSLCTSSGTSGSGPMLVVMSARDTPAWIGGSNRRVLRTEKSSAPKYHNDAERSVQCTIFGTQSRS